ncbi:hypothetical protein [Methylobacter sp.]|uniref:hypothetical protein n=1 Tax=Methylobacter sp. TaxID=2051955 RepID=UPI0025DAC58E|nr:hypothetical protein [Methylobacter sp.]
MVTVNCRLPYFQYLFDTLYHALAIHLNTVFVTADELYYRKAETVGYIQLLSDGQ